MAALKARTMFHQKHSQNHCKRQYLEVSWFVAFEKSFMRFFSLPVLYG